MTTRRKLLLALGTGTLAAAVTSFAQQPGKVWRIAFLSPGRSYSGPNWELILRGLRDLGYVEGQNIVIERRLGHGKLERLPELAAELVRLNVDCIVVGGGDAAVAAKQATSMIPVVMAATDDDPVRLGLVASLARPGGNVTGFINVGWKLAGKRLEWMKEALPNMSRAGLLLDPDSRPAAGYLTESTSVARAMRVTLHTLEVRKPEDLERAFRVARETRVEALMVVETGAANWNKESIIKLALETRLPAMGSTPTFAPAGGLMSYGVESYWTWRNAAIYVDRILKGAKPADLPVVQPTKFDLLINLKTARAIVLTIPESLLRRADKVIT